MHLDVVLNFWFEEFGIFNALAVGVLVSGGEMHFGLGEHEWEETVLSPHSVVAKWLAKGTNCLERFRTELRVVWPTIALIRTDSIFPFTILVMVVTVSVIAVMVAPFLR